MTSPPRPLQIAVDAGNTCLKLGAFAAPGPGPLPVPAETLVLPSGGWQPGALTTWLDQLRPSSPTLTWWLASVNDPALEQLETWLAAARPSDRATRLQTDDLPLRVDLERPHQVGIDRLLGVLAARQLTEPGRPALVVDLGTAIKANLLDSQGAFAGGAIAPGVQLAAGALHQQTELLPRIDLGALAAPPSPVGKSTEAALAAGLYWGALGTVRELIARLSSVEKAEPCVVLTGGDAPLVAPWLPDSVLHCPQLVLSGIALAIPDSPP